MTQPLPSNETNNQSSNPKPWLLKHYEAKRQRTVKLVKAAVDQLVKEKQTVTLEAICHASLALDPEGRGIKKSAILENPDAHAYYQEHSTSYQAMKKRNRKTRVSSAPDPQPLRIDPNRNVDRARLRYLHLTKAEIVERLLTVEQAYADLHLQLSRLQFQLLEQEHQRVEEQKQQKRNDRQKSERRNNNDDTRTTK
jgi:hypothetical protein